MFDTIVAPATPNAPATRAIVRISGPDARRAAASLVPGTRDLPARGVVPAHIDLGSLRTPARILTFPAPDSATGEDCVEIVVPGSPFLVAALLQRLCERGCRTAHAGEFTRRAYLNGRLDLAQAEAVMTLVNATTAEQARAARTILRGDFSRRGERRIAELEALCAQLEMSFDFDEEAASQAHVERFATQARELSGMLRDLAAGALSRVGMPRVVLCGAPNAGKSTLLNALLGRERAIVSEVAGTTRDVVEATLELASARVRLADTAGVWGAPASTLDAEAVEKTREEICLADAIVLVIDARSDGRKDALLLLDELTRGDATARSRMLVVRSKLDLAPTPVPLAHELADVPCLSLSAVWGDGLEELQRALERMVGHAAASERVPVSAWQAESIGAARTDLDASIEALEDGAGLEVVSSLARAALSSLRQAFGREASGDVLDRIFANFCIGK